MPIIALKTETLLGQRIKVWNNFYTKRKTIDCYTVVFLDQPTGTRNQQGKKLYDCVGMDPHPYYAQGFCQHSEAVLGRHLGERISFMKLNADCQQVVIDEIQAIRKDQMTKQQKQTRKAGSQRKQFERMNG